MQKYCIVSMQNKIMSFLIEGNGRVAEIHCDTTKSLALLGNIYVGKVKNIAKNLQAAFVEIQSGLICYLPLEDLRAPLFTQKGQSKNLQQGDELVVQISREAIKSKAPAVTTNLSFQGKYVILEPGKTGIGISKRLPEPERVRLRETGRAMTEVLAKNHAQDCSIILRTNAADALQEEIAEELEVLLERYRNIRETAVYRTCYSCLYQSPALWMKRMNSLRCRELGAIIIEETDLYQQAERYLNEERSKLKERLVHYQDLLLPLKKLYALEYRLEEALRERVWMKSGAYLVIQPTEALTVVDVNSGKNEGGKQKEAAILKVNLEAAKETARQLRLRNLSGIILVDFINMEKEESRKQVMEELRRCLLQDPLQAHVVDMTKLNLVEITRKKVERPLWEQIRID